MRFLFQDTTPRKPPRKKSPSCRSIRSAAFVQRQTSLCDFSHYENMCEFLKKQSLQENKQNNNVIKGKTRMESDTQSMVDNFYEEIVKEKWRNEKQKSPESDTALLEKWDLLSDCDFKKETVLGGDIGNKIDERQQDKKGQWCFDVL